MTSTQPCPVTSGGVCSSAEGFLNFASPGCPQRLGALPGLLLDLSGGVGVGDGQWVPACPRPSSLQPDLQAIQHIEGTQERQEQEEEQRRAVIVKPVRSCPEAHASDTASDSEASDSDAMDQSREEPAGSGALP